jgi:hypothetical protein
VDRASRDRREVAGQIASSFYRPNALKALYSGLVFVGTDTIDGRIASVIEGRLAGTGVQRLFFETGSGLLVRVTASTETPFGPLPEEFDLEDYRSVGAVKLPFVVSHLKPDFSSVDRIEKVQTNVPIDDVRFERPVAKR